MIPERATIFDFCFEKKASGSWCDWMDTIDKSTLAIPASAKVGKLTQGKIQTVLSENNNLLSWKNKFLKIAKCVYEI